ncbi:MAG: hypothetical protein ACREV5_07240 [Steroidobacter sp.]
MSIFESARRPPQWLRVALAALLLAFALNSIAHVTHRHDATAAAASHGVLCGYCVSFGGLADAPRHTYAAPAPTQVASRLALPAPVARSIDLRTSAQPRAPPLS